MQKLKIGLLGLGHLGKIHAKCIGLTDCYDFVGFYDAHLENNNPPIVEELGIQRFETLEDLLEVVDVVDIVTPTVTHFELAKKAIEKGKHIFIEKPITHTVEQAEELIRLSKEYGVKVQVGHVERFNPAFLAMEESAINPMFIEAHRLATFNPRGTDVSVVLDLMIHDLDIVLNLVQSKVTSVSASGVAVLSETPDIANARLEFANGCVANLTASRISLKQMRKVRFFQKDAYISLDFLDKNAQIVRMFEENAKNLPKDGNLMELETQHGKKMIHIDMPEISPINAIKMELETFGESILQNTRPKVSIEDGYIALKVAYQIIEDIEKRKQVLNE